MLTLLPVANVREVRSLLMQLGQGYHVHKISFGPDSIDHVGTFLEGGQRPVLWNIGESH